MAKCCTNWLKIFMTDLVVNLMSRATPVDENATFAPFTFEVEVLEAMGPPEIEAD